MTTPRDDIAGLRKWNDEWPHWQFTEHQHDALRLILDRLEEAATQLDSLLKERDALEARVKELEAFASSESEAANKLLGNGLSLVDRLENAESRAIRAEQERDEAYERADGLSDAISHAEDMLSKHIEEFHDFDYEPHQIPQELSQLNGIRHHLLGSLIDEKGEPIRRLASGPEKEG